MSLRFLVLAGISLFVSLDCDAVPIVRISDYDAKFHAKISAEQVGHFPREEWSFKAKLNPSTVPEINETVYYSFWGNPDEPEDSIFETDDLRITARVDENGYYGPNSWDAMLHVRRGQIFDDWVVDAVLSLEIDFEVKGDGASANFLVDRNSPTDVWASLYDRTLGQIVAAHNGVGNEYLRDIQLLDGHNYTYHGFVSDTQYDNNNRVNLFLSEGVQVVHTPEGGATILQLALGFSAVVFGRRAIGKSSSRKLGFTSIETGA